MILLSTNGNMIFFKRWKILFIIVFLLNAITTFGQNMQIPDTLRGMSFADSIVESKHITKKRYFNHNFKILKKELGNKDSIVVHNSNVKEFIGVLEDMGDFGIIKKPYHMVISAQQYHTVLNWYKKVSRIITLSMLKKFIKRNYMALCSDYEIEQMEILLSQYKKRLRLYYIMRINNMPQQ